MVDKKPVSEICNEAQIQPSLFYTWQRELMAGAPSLFSNGRRSPSREKELEEKVSRLEARVSRKDQFIAKDFKEFIRISGMTHVRISPYYPQSNGKIERWHKTMKSDALRPGRPGNLKEARQLMERFVAYYKWESQCFTSVCC